MGTIVVLLFLQIFLLSFQQGDCSTSVKDLEAKENAEIEKKRRHDEMERKAEETATKQTLEKLGRLGRFRSSVNNLFKNIPLKYENSSESAGETPTIASTKSFKPTKFQMLNLNQTREGAARFGRNNTSVKPTNMSYYLSMYQNKAFFSNVRKEISSKDVKGEANILPAHHHKNKPAVRHRIKLEDDHMKPSELHAEFMNEKQKTGELENHKEFVNTSNYIQNKTTGVLKPGDIERTSTEASEKNPIRLMYQPSEHLKMYFEKKNETKIEKEKSEIKAKVTVFGADDIDLSTSTPNVQHHGKKEEENTTVSVGNDDKDNVDRLQHMKDYLKHTRKDLNFRSYIPKVPVVKIRRYKIPKKSKYDEKPSENSDSDDSNDVTKMTTIVGSDEDGMSESHDTNI